jgi:prepilin-type processing-associated H-X9-DG protein
MNCTNALDMEGVNMIKKRMQIPHPTYRVVFLDDGGTSPAAKGGWTVYIQQEKWWDPPPVRHGDGTNFSFVDGHSEYHKWEDPRTIEFGKKIPPSAQSPVQDGNVDIRWAAIAVWGKAGRQ